MKWDMYEISGLISRFGTKQWEMEGPVWISIDRIIINDYKKINTSVILFEGMS